MVAQHRSASIGDVGPGTEQQQQDRRTIWRTLEKMFGLKNYFHCARKLKNA